VDDQLLGLPHLGIAAVKAGEICTALEVGNAAVGDGSAVAQVQAGQRLAGCRLWNR
jgi:hypothetical protein